MGKVALVAGAGAGLGGSIARRFVRAGYRVALGARKGERLERMAAAIAARGGEALAVPMDVRDPTRVEAVFDQVEATYGPVEIAIFNAGAQYRASIPDTDPVMFEKVWRLGCYAGFVFGRQAARRMVARGRGTILFTGATASIRAGGEFSAFAAAKFGLRAVARSLARALGPRNIHVAHIIIDGLIDTAAIRERFPDVVESLPDDGSLDPDAVADAYYQRHAQARSAWTFELDLRPWVERF